MQIHVLVKNIHCNSCICVGEWVEQRNTDAQLLRVLCFMTEEKGKLELESWVRVDFRQNPPHHHHLWENFDKYRLSGSLELCLAWIYSICLFSVKHFDVPWAHFSVFREICESFVEGRLKMLRSEFSVSCAEIWKGILTVLGRKKKMEHIFPAGSKHMKICAQLEEEEAEGRRTEALPRWPDSSCVWLLPLSQTFMVTF